MFKYTPEQKDFIREAAPGRYNSEISSLFNERFGTNLTEGQIKSFKTNHKIKSNVPRRKSVPEGLFSTEQIDFIKENIKGRLNQDLAELINEKFSLQITAKQMKTWKSNHNLSSGLNGSEGMAPPNKGTKGLYNVGGNNTSFKPGDRPLNYKPVGYERIDRDGYTLVKVSDDGRWHERWKHKHKVVWELANGPIPKGHVLLFADQNKSNIVLDNLVLITKSKLSIVNKKGLLHKDADLTRTGLIIADLYSAISTQRKKGSKSCKSRK